jgi:hypothetical protein
MSFLNGLRLKSKFLAMAVFLITATMKTLPWFAFSSIILLTSICLAAETPSISKDGQGTEFSPYEMSLISKIVLFKVDHLSKAEYLEFRSICMELSVCNRPRFARALKAMLVETPFVKSNPGHLAIWDISHDFNLAVLLAMLAQRNKITLADVEIADLKSRAAGLSSLLKSREQVTFIVDFCSAIEETNNNQK